MSIRPRNHPGREVFEFLQKFEWRFQTLKTDHGILLNSRDPEPDSTVSTHRYAVRSSLHNAERLLHHYLSAYYSFKSLTTTLAENSPNPEFNGRLKDRRDQFALLNSTRAVLGLRHYIQHHNIIPLLIKLSTIREGGPWYVINKRELRLDNFEYNQPQMVRDVPEYDDYFNYYFESVDGICIYPFQIIGSNWSDVEALREDIYELARAHLFDEISEYVNQLEELEVYREVIKEEEESMKELLEQMNGVTPELRELLTPEIYDRIVAEREEE